MGKDVWTLTPTQITNAAKVHPAWLEHNLPPHVGSDHADSAQSIWVTQVTYIPAICVTKVVIVCFFMQVFPGPKFRLLCYGTIVWCFTFMVSTIITAILSCMPVEKMWTNWRRLAFHHTETTDSGTVVDSSGTIDRWQSGQRLFSYRYQYCKHPSWKTWQQERE
jgi:hypothetical protein